MNPCLRRCLFTLSLFCACVSMGRPQPPAPAPTAAGQRQINLQLRREGGLYVVQMQEFLVLLDRLAPGAVGRWDPANGILRIQLGPQTIDLLSRKPYILVNQRMQKVDQPVIVRQGEVFIPLPTIESILTLLGVEFEKKLDEPGATPSPPPVAANAAPEAASSLPAVNPELFFSATPSATPLPPAAETATTTSLPSVPLDLLPPPAVDSSLMATPVQTAPPTSGPLVVMPVLAPTPGAAESAASEMTPLEAPPELAGRVGLTWGQLADLAHRSPPRRIALVCDRAFQELARQARQTLENNLALDVSVIVTASPARADDALLSQVNQVQPELLVDLLAVPRPDAPGEDIVGFVVWVVHDALWPEDRQAPQAPGSVTARYQRHQFQSLALGSLLRTELGRQFPDRVVLYELAPLYLPRRVDAPAATVLIPVSDAGSPDAVDQNRAERIAHAVSEAVSRYYRGMKTVEF